MAAKTSPGQKQTIERVMHEFKHGELDKRDGEPVTNPKQAIAIALHEAGTTNEESPERNKRTLARTKRKERAGDNARDQAEGRAAQASSRKDLYAEARRLGIPGRSAMSKADLQRAVRAHRS